MKKYVVLLALIFLIASPAFCNDINEDSFDIAKNYYDTGNYASALEYVNTILDNTPDYYKAELLKVKLVPPDKNKNGNILTKSIIINPDCQKTDNIKSDNYNAKGLEYLKEQDYIKAKSEFQKAIRYNIFNYYAYNNLGLTYKKLGNYKKAVSNYKHSIFFKRNYSIAYDNLAQTYIELESYSKAIKVLKKSISICDNDYISYYLLGIAQKNLCNYNDAIQNFNKVTELAPKYSLSYIQLADTYYFTKDYSWSNISADKYITLCPDDDFAYYIKYRNTMAVCDYDLAEKYIVKAILINNCYKYRKELGEIKILQNKPNEAIENFELIKDKTSDIYNSIGECYVTLGDNSKAIENFKKAIYSKITRPLYIYNLAQCYKNNNDEANYKKYVSVITGYKPVCIQDYVDLSYIYMNMFSKNSALDIINSGLVKYPDSKELIELKTKLK